ncbi:MAG: ABC transporter ATP-binding protein/permease [Deltaproteobacteria bacterium]|nr:ABC transporter ATP-binding protein/permease [Deltaproteobacteria bacterium]MBT4637963.1 ABC transporter ATP-binding protein/permease [Deltaproteobacteria bacterium]MBT7155773.1 ABC transporter ATP-binding protein/permease [Deltaproteobacteria bacterium]MBT7710570.1 ABC transporter ATP-binding protein/permease [Deltaproteobacteria bacterium]MBT7888958.1 ABC transporter ATP-binding protein/permease [Deltaproteobacteria bacterium]
MTEKISTETDTENRSPWLTIKDLLTYLWPVGRTDLRTRVLLAMIFLAAAKIITVYIPFLYKSAVDSLSLDGNMLALPLGVIIAYGSARVLTQVFGELRDFVFVRVAQHAQRTISLSTFKHLHALSLRFHLERQTGGLSRVIERGTRGIQFVLTFSLFNILPTIFEIMLVTIVLFVKLDIRFAAITFFTISGYIVYTLAVTSWRLKFRRQMNAKDSEANTKAIDSLLNYETVKYFGNEGHEYKRYDEALAGYEFSAIRSQTSLSILNVGQGFIIGVGLVVVMALAGSGVVQGQLTIGDFVLVNTFLIQLFLPLNFLGFVYREIRQGLIDMEKMFELLDINAEVRDPIDARSLKIENGVVEFKNVSFGYSEDRGILRNISFTVPAGQTVAIVGPSGAGKSTISKLLYRFYDVSSGSITIDGQDIQSVTQQSLRDAIGVVPQDTVLFNDTIAYNIQYGDPLAGPEIIEEAAKLASLHEFIAKLPQGYETMVGERGLKLSGGEKQRVAIARTIVKDPDVLIFDEATSSLDSLTEKEIQHSLVEVSRNRTTLVIAHRLSTIIDADEILVLKDGEIVEQGNHNDLVEQDGEYASIWMRQREAREYQSRLLDIEKSCWIEPVEV